MHRMRIGWVWPLFVALALTLASQPLRVEAQAWPPFDFDLAPTHAGVKITYALQFSSRVDGPVTDLTIKVPLPPGTRFLEGGSRHPGVQVSFDGTEVTVFAAVIHRTMRDVSFVVAIDDPVQTVFVTHAWIKWSGSAPGEYTTPDVTIDITRPPLNWVWPDAVLDLGASALATADAITYSVHTRNVGWMRMWDLTVDVQLPPGVARVRTEAPSTFAAGAVGAVATFKTIELGGAVDMEPLRIVAAVDAAAGTALPAHVAARWRNEGWDVGVTYPAEGQAALSDLTVQSGLTQLVVADVAGDVPLPHNDLTGIAFVPEVDALKVVFSTVGDSVQEQDPVEFALYLDVDCNPATGEPTADGIGSDLRASAEPIYRGANLETWDAQASDWTPQRTITGHKPATSGQVMLWLPRAALPDAGRLCWAAQAESWNARRYDRYPPSDAIVSHPDMLLDLDGWAGRTDQPSSRVPPPGAQLTPLNPLVLAASALVAGDRITYTVRAENNGLLDLANLRITLPLPEGVPPAETVAAPPFSAAAGDGALVFSAPGLAPGAASPPLQVVLSAAGGEPITTRVAAVWQNTGWDVGIAVPSDGQAATGNLSVQPGVDQLAVADPLTDVPAAYYDLEGIAFMPEDDSLKVVFSTAGNLVAAQKSVELRLYLDADCDPQTGEATAGGIGSDYRVGAEPLTQLLYYEVWDGQAAAWRPYRPVRAAVSPDRNQVNVWVPFEALPAGAPLCWLATAAAWQVDDPSLGPGYDEMVSNADTRLDLARWSRGHAAATPEAGPEAAEPGVAGPEPAPGGGNAATLNLQLGALVSRDAITYSVYVDNTGASDRQALTIDLPLPAGTDLAVTEQPDDFAVAVAEDRTVSFSAPDLGAGASRVLRAGVRTPVQDGAPISTRLAATWQLGGWGADGAEPERETAVTRDLVVEAGRVQLQVVSVWNDVTPADHELAGLAFVPQGSELKIVFVPAGDVVAAGRPVEFAWYVDADCNPATGERVAEDIGAEYWAGNAPNAESLYFEVFDAATRTWSPYKSIRRGAGPDRAVIWIPRAALPAAGPLCWLAGAFAEDVAAVPYPGAGEIRSNPATRLDMATLSES